MGRCPHQAQWPKVGSVAGLLDISCNDDTSAKFTSQLNGFISAYPRAFLISGQVVLGEEGDVAGEAEHLVFGRATPSLRPHSATEAATLSL